MSGAADVDVRRSLHSRLQRSLGSNEAELRVFGTYARRYAELGPDIPALLPQAYLHYDPYTRARHGSGLPPLARQRMDFLLLLPGRVRVVIECDGALIRCSSARSPEREPIPAGGLRGVDLAGGVDGQWADGPLLGNDAVGDEVVDVVLGGGPPVGLPLTPASASADSLQYTSPPMTVNAR